MLDDHPVTQKALLGAGAFLFVFSAAMAGTGVMISGGFGLNDARDSSRPAERYLLLARADENDNPYSEQNALENWARQLRIDAEAEAAPAAPQLSASAQPSARPAAMQTEVPAAETVNTYAALAEAFATAPPLGATQPN